MKVIVVKLKDEDAIVCLKSSFVEDSAGILRIVAAWRLDNVDFQDVANSYRVDSTNFNPVWSHDGKKDEDACVPKLIRHISIKDYLYYYEDEMQSLVK